MSTVEFEPDASPRVAWRQVRAPLAVVLALALLATAGFLLTGRRTTGDFDPEGIDRNGSRAVAELLRGNGVDVTRVTTVDGALAKVDDDSTVFVPQPSRLSPASLAKLVAGSGRAALVVAEPDADDLAALTADVTTAGTEPPGTREPACELAVARRAGAVQTGGATFDVAQGVDADRCYSSGGDPTLVRVGRLTVLGLGTVFTNEALDEEGNAALALGLLGAGERVVWLLPRPGDPPPPADGEVGIADLLPDRVYYVGVALAVAAVLFAAWRGRRLGPVVVEPLPVVVRAAETVEGRARLYRSARARDRAAEALREGRRASLVAILGLAADDRAALVETVSARTGRTPVEVESLLYGAAPGDDRTLVRLADDLDTLDAEVRRR